MLTFFPTPYEDELWYGIITRYHIRSGNTYWKYTIQELFPEIKGYPRLGDTMPNTSMQIIAAQLPENVLSLRDCALRHSLFPFRMRFQPLEKKREYLQEFLDGENMQPKFLFTTKRNGAEMPLRSCPQCAVEDVKQYGEPYWHTEHQIASLPLCPKHLCRLVPLPRQNTMSIGQQLILPPKNLPDAVFAATETEYSLTEALHYMYTLPYETSPNLLSENLSTTIENAGFLEDGNILRQSWDVQRLYTALTERFGTDIVVRCFGKHITKAHARRLRRYEIYSTEEYAILAVLLDIPPLAFFSGVALPLELDMKMRELACQGQVYTKARAAQLLGIREDQLLPYAKRFGIRPFWVQSGKPCADDKRQTYSVEIRLSAQEKEELDAYMAAHNMDVYGHALRYFMQKNIGDWKNNHTNERSFNNEN